MKEDTATAERFERNRPGGRPDDDALVFPTQVFPAHDGDPWDRGDSKNWRRRIFAPAVRKAELPKSRPYDLRQLLVAVPWPKDAP